MSSLGILENSRKKKKKNVSVGLIPVRSVFDEIVTFEVQRDFAFSVSHVLLHFLLFGHFRDLKYLEETSEAFRRTD